MVPRTLALPAMSLLIAGPAWVQALAPRKEPAKSLLLPDLTTNQARNKLRNPYPSHPHPPYDG